MWYRHLVHSAKNGKPTIGRLCRVEYKTTIDAIMIKSKSAGNVLQDQDKMLVEFKIERMFPKATMATKHSQYNLQLEA